jgi:hypothetical protein
VLVTFGESSDGEHDLADGVAGELAGGQGTGTPACLW